MIPVVGYVVERLGWRIAYSFMGALGLAILIPVILIFVKDKPENMGLLPYRSPKAASASANAPASHNHAIWRVVYAAQLSSRFNLLLRPTWPPPSGRQR